MIEFIKNALPYMIIGFCLAFMCVRFSKKKKGNCPEDHMTEGMCIGMCLGVALSTAIHINIGWGISLGMLFGELVGMQIKRK